MRTGRGFMRKEERAKYQRASLRLAPLGADSPCTPGVPWLRQASCVEHFGDDRGDRRRAGDVDIGAVLQVDLRRGAADGGSAGFRFHLVVLVEKEFQDGLRNTWLSNPTSDVHHTSAY